MPWWPSKHARPPRTIAILGRAGCAWIDDPPPGHERWIINDAWSRFATRSDPTGMQWDAWDRAFDLHSLAHIRRKRRAHLDWLQMQQGSRPVYLLDPDGFAAAGDAVPNAVRYPREDVQARFAWRLDEPREEYFTSSLDWLIALALYEGVDRLELYGVDMWDWGNAVVGGPAVCSERKEQREGGTFWIGRALGMGVDVWIETGSSICRTEREYGTERLTGSNNYISMSLARFQHQLEQARAMEAHDGERTPDADEGGSSQPTEATPA